VITMTTSTCDVCGKPSVLTTIYNGESEHWCDGCWENFGGWVCDECQEFLPYRAFGDFEEDKCEVCRTVGRATNFAEFL